MWEKIHVLNNLNKKTQTQLDKILVKNQMGLTMMPHGTFIKWSVTHTVYEVYNVDINQNTRI